MGSVLWLLSIIIQLIVIIDRLALHTHLLLMSLNMLMLLCPWIIIVTAGTSMNSKSPTDHQRLLYQSAWTWSMNIDGGNQGIEERIVLSNKCAIVCVHSCMIITSISYYHNSHASSILEIIWRVRGICQLSKGLLTTHVMGLN